MELGKVWYYMIYLSDNDFLKFWGKINMWANTGYHTHITFIVGFIVTIISIYLISGIFKIRKRWSFLIGLLLSPFVTTVFVQHSGEIRNLVMDKAQEVYLQDKSKFDDWEEFNSNLKNVAY